MNARHIHSVRRSAHFQAGTPSTTSQVTTARPRLRWAFACPEHACLLVDVCPECGRWQRVGQLPAWLTPTPGACARKAVGTRGRALPRCGAALSGHDIVRLHFDDAVVTAQRRLLGYLHSRSVSDRNYQSHPVDVW